LPRKNRNINDTLTKMELNKYSKTFTQDPTQPAAQAMLYGIGLTDADMEKAQVGIARMATPAICT